MKSACLSCRQSVSPAFVWKDIFTFSAFKADPLFPSDRWLCNRCLAEVVFLSEKETCQQCSRLLSDIAPSYRVQTELGEICLDCQRWLEWEAQLGLGPILVRNRSVIVYNDWAQELISRYKFGKDERLKYFFASLIWEHDQQTAHRSAKKELWHISSALESSSLGEHSCVGSERNFFPPLSMFDVIIPIPLSSKRLYERGFNQAGHLAQLLAEKYALPCEREVLLCTDDEERQSQKPRSARLQEMLQKYLKHPRSSVDIQGKNILLIDDIYTTGATVRAAAYRLRKEGAQSVHSYTVAR